MERSDGRGTGSVSGSAPTAALGACGSSRHTQIMVVGASRRHGEWPGKRGVANAANPTLGASRSSREFRGARFGPHGSPPEDSGHGPEDSLATFAETARLSAAAVESRRRRSRLSGLDDERTGRHTGSVHDGDRLLRTRVASVKRAAIYERPPEGEDVADW